MKQNYIEVQKDDLGLILCQAPNNNVDTTDLKSTLKYQALFCLKKHVKLFFSLVLFLYLYTKLIQGL